MNAVGTGQRQDRDLIFSEPDGDDVANVLHARVVPDPVQLHEAVGPYRAAVAKRESTAVDLKRAQARRLEDHPIHRDLPRRS